MPEQIPQEAKTALWNTHVAYQGVRPQSESGWIDALLTAAYPAIRKQVIAEVEKALTSEAVERRAMEVFTDQYNHLEGVKRGERARDAMGRAIRAAVATLKGGTDE